MTGIGIEAERIRSKDNVSGCVSAVHSASAYPTALTHPFSKLESEESPRKATSRSGLFLGSAEEFFGQTTFSLLICEQSITFHWAEGGKVQGAEKRETKQVLGNCPGERGASSSAPTDAPCDICS